MYAIGDATNGITLVALVVTIVVLLILAGITLVYVFGDNEVFGQASKAKIQTELGKIEERAQVIYLDKLLETASSTLSTKVEASEVISQLISEGYTIEERPVSVGDINGISLDKTNITMKTNGTAEITVTYERVDDSFVYYIEVQGKYYQMYSNKGFITIDREASNLTKSDFESENGGEGNTSTLTVTSSDETVATAKVKEGSTNVIEITSKEKETTTGITITVTYGSYPKDDENYTKKCTVMVKEPVLATALELNSVRARIATGATRWLNAVATPAEAEQEFEWTSSNIDIATVDSTGKVTAKKAGTATITVKTKDGSNNGNNFSKECKVTIVDAVDVATLTEIQRGEKNIIAKDSNGNLITVPIGFKVLTSEGTKVTDGIVISDETGDGNGNEFVWVPVDSVSTGTTKVADDIRLGRYQGFTAKNTTGNYVPKQDANDYAETDASKITINSYYQELTSNSGNTAAKSLGTFVDNTIASGGYYLARYEASGETIGTVKSQYNQPVWNKISQSTAATNCRNMYQGNRYVWSDLVNSYAWDTAIIFIQKYEDNDYAYQKTIKSGSSPCAAGTTGDCVCNIHDMASNCFEWSTEHSILTNSSSSSSSVYRGGDYSNRNQTTSYRGSSRTSNYVSGYSFRPLLYIKLN